jgi:hypothetical protein
LRPKQQQVFLLHENWQKIISYCIYT